MQLKNPVPSPPPKMLQNFPIVGLGASAGGLEALKKFMEKIDARSGMAYVLVLHLSPTHESNLPQILARFTKLPVHEITNDINLAPDNVYIIPENKVVTTQDGVLKLTPRDPENKKNRPIDVFFSSLAEVHKSFAIGAVFSGTGFDGTEGLKFIKEHGGVTYAQSPESAAFKAMPENAINSGSVDFIMVPEEIPQHLQHVKKAYQASHSYSDENKLRYEEENVFKQILRVLLIRTGNDFSHYKQPTLRRRIARRMVMTQNEMPGQYLKFLKTNAVEQDALFNDVLIPVSYFFRDPDIFDSLNDTVFPILINNNPNKENIRIWIAGCSTGEEAYSMAICLHEFLTKRGLPIKVQIFATDVSENIIAKARIAEYSMEDLRNVSESRLQTYFTKKGAGYEINKFLRDMCIFAVHNFLKDPPFAKIDLISCRNVLIYFSPYLQKKALTTFHYSLNKNGLLFLGRSETARNAANLFEPVIKKSKIYTRKSSANDRFLGGHLERKEISINALQGSISDPIRPQNEPDFQKTANSILLNRYTPAGVIIDHNRDIIHYHGDTSPFLAQTTGKPHLNILKMAREGLGFELRNALLKGKTSPNISKKDIHLKGKDYLVDFEIIELPSDLEKYFLILFQKRDILLQEEGRSGNSIYKQRIKILESEIEQLREDIRSVTEDQEVANDELQSANEELLSGSEELQSLNEELETTTEELQSNNEELITVNDELMDRQEQLINSRKNAEAIVETIREPIVILDKRMQVKKANNSFYLYFKTTEQETVGRVIFELNNGHWDRPELRYMLENLISKGKMIENYEITGNFPNIGQHSILINARQILNGKQSEELILMAFEDVTEQKMSKILRESEERFRVMADTTPFLLWIAEPDGQLSFLNKSWLDYTGRSLEQEKGFGWTEGIHEEDKELVLGIYKKRFNAKEEINIEYRLKRHDGVYRWITVKGVARFGIQGEFMGYVGGCMEIHEQKNFSAALEEKVAQRTAELRDSQNFLKSILNMTQNVIYLYDFEKSKMVFVNSRVEHCTGYSPEVIVQAEQDLYTKMIHQEDLEHVVAQRKKIQKSKDGELITMKYRIQNLDGKWTHQLSLGLVFSRDERGKSKQYIGVATDITDLQNTNELLQDKNRELEHSNIELASFSSIASHDLQEPLRKIQLFLNLVLQNEKDGFSKESQDYLKRVIVSAHRMQQLINDLISYSRTSAQKIEYTKTDLNKLLVEVLDDLKENIEGTGAVIEVGHLSHASVIPSQFRQLFVNLIANALKFRRPNVEPHIKISSEIIKAEEIRSLGEDPDKSFCKISIIDNGIGFPDEQKFKIFEPFQRLHGKEEYSGTGIGLAICKKIVANHNGMITAESGDGKGATFNIYVPLKN